MERKKVFYMEMNHFVLSRLMYPKTLLLFLSENQWFSIFQKQLRDKKKRLYIYMLYFELRPSPKILFQGDTPEGNDTFQWPVIERDRVGGLRLMIWDKVKVPLCHYSDAPEESNLWTAWLLFPLDDD